MLIGVVVPFLDERLHLGELLDSMEAQRRPPDRLVLVDDGSADGSGELAERFAAGHDYAVAVRRPARPAGDDRLAAAAELAAFQWAVAEHADGWDVVAKLDADLRLPPCTLSELERHLAENPRLGIVGTFLVEPADDGGLARIAIGEGHVHGATKFYRRACWEAIAPLPTILGWDTIDEVRARRAGWWTRSVALPAGDPVHLRPRGAQDGLTRGYRRWGRCAWAFGEPPVLVAAQAARHMRRAPVVRGGLHYALGWALAALTRAPRAEPEVRAHLAGEQWRRVRRRLGARG